MTVPLRIPFGSAHSSRNARELFLVRVVDSDGVEGWGECVAETVVGYSMETLAKAAKTIQSEIVPRLAAEANVATKMIDKWSREIPDANFACAAVQQAVLDAELRSSGISLANYLGVKTKRVAPGVVIGLQSDTSAVLELIDTYLDAGYARIKFKIEPGNDVELVSLIRDHVGADVVLQVDANGSYGVGDLEHLQLLDAFHLAMIEQPLPPTDIEGSVAVASALNTPVCLDEGVGNLVAMSALLDAGAGSIINIKPGRMGGLLEAGRALDACLERGVGCWIGGMLETGVGRAANVVLAAHNANRFPGDISASSRYFETDLTEPFEMVDGLIEVPVEPGASRHPIEGVLEHFGARFERLI